MMMTIIILMMAAAVMMARRGRGRAMGRYIRGNVDEELALAALASKDVVGAVFDETVTERTKVTSIVATYSLGELTPAAGVGPIICGVAHSDYTDAEIEEWLELSGQWAEGNMVAREVASRKIRQIGTFETPDGATSVGVLNDGRAIKTKLNWILTTGQTLRLWAYNSGLQPVATTTPSLTVNGHVNLFPQ